MELLAAVVSIITLGFFVTIIALVAIVFGQQRTVDQAVQALGGSLKTVLKNKVKDAYQKARKAPEEQETATPPRQKTTWAHSKRRIQRFPSDIHPMPAANGLVRQDG
jgi:Sec-independent protein translocase protein TatA